jgi:hypothetical protein
LARRYGVEVLYSCSLCGTTAEGGEQSPPDGWSFSVEEGRIRYQCGACIRANIRAIEAKLPQEWWE